MLKKHGKSKYNILFKLHVKMSIYIYVLCKGVGISILSYAGRLQLGILADRALISCHEDAQDILDGIITSINEMYETSL